MAICRQWTGQFHSNPTDLPISFTYDGKAIAGIPAAWAPVRHRRFVDATLTETIIEGLDPQTGLAVRVEVTEYLDYPVVEWVAWLSNTASQPTPILRDILAIDGVFQGASPVLWHCNGDMWGRESYAAQETPMVAGRAMPFGATGGKPCRRAFPYFRLMFSDGGLSIAIGWPGQWTASFTSSADGVRVQAGQEQTHLRLMPGESIRTPRMTVLCWAGDSGRAVNLWRRWYRGHLLPRPNGQPLRPMLAGAGTDDGEEFTAATEENQLRYLDRWIQRDLPIDVWWIDAGWYPCYDTTGRREWANTGTWQPDPQRFPNGLKAVSDRAAHHGADLLLWFEPERVMAGTALDHEHPEWLLFGTKTGEGRERLDWRLLNLGDPACRQWLTNHVCDLIRSNGVKIYRQDFNFKPLSYWRDHDAEDRQGITENLYHQGYLQYWDDLVERNPGLWLDSCASGGTRNDLETLRRSVPLHYSDYGYGDHPVKLAFQHILFEWMPYFKDTTLSWDQEGQGRYNGRIDSYSYHCGLAPMLFPCIDIRREDYDFALMRKMLGVWRRVAEWLINGDYYPLTPIHRSPDRWVARQFDCPEAGRGFIQAIRLPACPQETLVVRPRAMRPKAVYLFENPETGDCEELAGSAIEQRGFTFSLPKREGAIWIYRVK